MLCRYVFFDSQEAYLCASFQMMEMVLIHILFLQHLKRLCKIHLTAGWEHSCRARCWIPTQSSLLLLLLLHGPAFQANAFAPFCFQQVDSTPKGSEQMYGVSHTVFSTTLTTFTADLRAMRAMLRRDIPRCCSVNTDYLFHTSFGLLTTLPLPAREMLVAFVQCNGRRRANNENRGQKHILRKKEAMRQKKEETAVTERKRQREKALVFLWRPSFQRFPTLPIEKWCCM